MTEIILKTEKIDKEGNIYTDDLCNVFLSELYRIVNELNDSHAEENIEKACKINTLLKIRDSASKFSDFTQKICDDFFKAEAKKRKQKGTEFLII